MSIKALADSLNHVTSQYNSGVIDHHHYVEMCEFHNACYQRKCEDDSNRIFTPKALGQDLQRNGKDF